ncbi:MAG: DUF3717 domain-containing protein [Rhodoferax sp.]|uniref:DUF3717 domain-containing protein n=1 Tax=Rhodoferax sp. TaxID=50421 RepID=UPI00261A3BB2|nr:DUF3717 domain-containing protein [Rhodoferax sp.]MDD5332982.1 DUF3717 domain-containing protein [Rhodoferax sp.]
MAGIHITDIESAINYWRDKTPSPDGFSLTAPTRVLAELYALMVFDQVLEIEEFLMPAAALQAWLAWYATTPDTPCIAICSTSQGDAQCKGCGRSFAEVQHWTEMRPAEKRQTWRRITMEGSSWRFNKYAERAAEGGSASPSSPLAERGSARA